jgi:predicted nucleotidyltransferase
MSDPLKPADKLVWFLRERAKELNCLYKIEELLNQPDAILDNVCQGVVQAIPSSWQYPDICQVKITIEESVYNSPDYKDTPWCQSADITVHDEIVGRIIVNYSKDMPAADQGPFLNEETKLIETIADRLGHFITYHMMKHLFAQMQTAKEDLLEHRKEEWRVVIDLLRQTDRNLYLKISHKMLNHLCWSGIEVAKQLLQYYNPDQPNAETELMVDSNRPHQKSTLAFFSDFLSDETFKIAADNLSDGEILSLVQKWIQEDKFSFLMRIVNRNLDLSEVAEAIRRYHHNAPADIALSPSIQKGVNVALIRRFFSENLSFINVAKNYFEVGDFYELMQSVIFSPDSHGSLGGKSAGLYLAARIVKRSSRENDAFQNLKTPMTWYLTSDMLLHFMHYNHLDEVTEQKYKEINQVRLEYPNIVQTFKNSYFPPEVVKGLSVALDDFKDKPLIVRSSSLLEDGMGAAFSGKYKSLFLANQGTKQERLDALVDAIAEVYASTFGPDPIEYRTERGLLDFHEEMGIMIQEVVGTRIGNYYMPAYAGVLFSNNEFRWSARIKREDGLIRIVPGLGTRAVDRLSDDYPVLIAPGQPDLRVNVTTDEMVKYAPRKIDVINLETNTFETISIDYLLKKFGHEYPVLSQIVSVYDGDTLRQPSAMGIDFEKDQLVATFNGLVSRTPFIGQARALAKLLQQKLGTPVDIEFASDGKDFYLLQCRPQSYADDSVAAPIPKDVAEEKILFTANKYISNGRVPDITHIVYVDPIAYGEIADRATMLAVGRAVGALNKLLPKRQFILMGPGRWGSRGDIKLGVSVTYSEINNTAVMIEIARKKGKYLPDLSFGTHFFQDLVEARIRYLPLYPDDPAVKFNERFIKGAPNILAEVLPEYANLVDVIRLIDVPKATNGLILQVLMNADLEEAIGILTAPKTSVVSEAARKEHEEQHPENYWRWRMRMAENIALQLNPEQFAVKGMYVFGSTKNGTAGPHSDIDILIHFQGNEEQREKLEIWLNGWSLSLDEMNYMQTGYRSGGLLDVHIVTDDDIARRTSFAVKIDAVTDAARPLPLRKR